MSDLCHACDALLDGTITLRMFWSKYDQKHIPQRVCRLCAETYAEIPEENMAAMTCPPNIAEWIAQEPNTRIWRRDSLLIWNFHPRLGIQVDGGPLAPLLPSYIHQCMCDALYAEARRQLSHLESQARDYYRMANEMREIRDTIKR